MVKKLSKSKPLVSTKFKNHSILDFFPFLNNLKINLSPTKTSNNNKIIIRKEPNIMANLITNNQRKRNHTKRRFISLKRKESFSESSSSSIDLNSEPKYHHIPKSPSIERKNSSSESSSSIEVSPLLKYHKKSGILSLKSKESNSESDSSKILNNKFYAYDLSESPFKNKEKIEREKPEWMKEETEQIMYSKLRYNLEILDYIDYVTPKGEIKAKREMAFNQLKQTIELYNKNFEVVLFGSSAQNLSTIYSDLDITIINHNSKYYNRYNEINELNAIMLFLMKNGFSYNIDLIHARVPIIKGVHYLTDIKFDISYNRINGYEDSLIIRQILDENEIMRKAIIILKIFLKINNLNEPFTGGMGSYLLLHLAYFFDLKCKESNDMKYHNVFFFIYLFFEYFGTKFNFDKYGISLKQDDPGEIFEKHDYYVMNNYKNICVESISERYINIGESCFNYEEIIQLFNYAYHKIKKAEEDNSLSILQELGFSANLE